REKDLWARGLEDWEQLRSGGLAVLGRKVHDSVCAAIDRAKAALDEGDLPRLVEMLPARGHWRPLPPVGGGGPWPGLRAPGGGGATPAHGRRLSRRRRAGELHRGSEPRRPARAARRAKGLGDLQRRLVRSPRPPARLPRALPAGAPPGPQAALPPHRARRWPQ